MFRCGRETPAHLSRTNLSATSHAVTLLKSQDALEDVVTPQTHVWTLAEEAIEPKGGFVCQHDQPSSGGFPSPLPHRHEWTLGQLRRPDVPEGGPQSPAAELQERAEPVPAAAKAAPRQCRRSRPVQPGLGACAGQSEAEVQLASPPRHGGRRGHVFTHGADRHQLESCSRQPELRTGFDPNQPRGNPAGPNGLSVHIQSGSGAVHTGRCAASDG